MEQLLYRVHEVPIPSGRISRRLDTPTIEHSLRVTELSLQVAHYAGIRDRTTLRRLSNAAKGHDLGKVAIDPDILNKPGKLTPEEKAIVDTHAKIGADIVLAHGFDHQTAELIELHHAYQKPPRRLELAILQEMDIWDALTKERPYKSAWKPEAAFRYIVTDLNFLPHQLEPFQAWYYDLASKPSLTYSLAT